MHFISEHLFFKMNVTFVYLAYQFHQKSACNLVNDYYNIRKVLILRTWQFFQYYFYFFDPVGNGDKHIFVWFFHIIFKFLESFENILENWETYLLLRLADLSVLYYSHAYFVCMQTWTYKMEKLLRKWLLCTI